MRIQNINALKRKKYTKYWSGCVCVCVGRERMGVKIKKVCLPVKREKERRKNKMNACGGV